MAALRQRSSAGPGSGGEGAVSFWGAEVVLTGEQALRKMMVTLARIPEGLSLFLISANPRGISGCFRLQPGRRNRARTVPGRPLALAPSLPRLTGVLSPLALDLSLHRLGT